MTTTSTDVVAMLQDIIDLVKADREEHRRMKQDISDLRANGGDAKPDCRLSRTAYGRDLRIRSQDRRARGLTLAGGQQRPARVRQYPRAPECSE